MKIPLLVKLALSVSLLTTLHWSADFWTSRDTIYRMFSRMSHDPIINTMQPATADTDATDDSGLLNSMRVLSGHRNSNMLDSHQSRTKHSSGKVNNRKYTHSKQYKKHLRSYFPLSRENLPILKRKSLRKRNKQQHAIKTHTSDRTTITHTHIFKTLKKVSDENKSKTPIEQQPRRHKPTSLQSIFTKPVINPHNFSYIHNPSIKCELQETDILFVVPSAPQNFGKRRSVRSIGIGNNYKPWKPDGKITVIFFIGVPAPTMSRDEMKEEKQQDIIDQESTEHGDIVQENFFDVYINIRLKAVMMLKWASTFCQHANYVIRTDDDVVVFSTPLIEAIRDVGRERDNFILGDVKTGYAPMRSIGNKYYVSRDEYPDETYPTFALGGLLGYPMKTVRLLYHAAQRVKTLWLDDVYITGICAPLVNATLVKDYRFKFMH